LPGFVPVPFCRHLVPFLVPSWQGRACLSGRMYVRWLDEIEDFRFYVTHLPGARNPTDPLSRRGFADGDGPAASTGDTDAESQQELFSRLGCDAPAPARLAAVRATRPVGRRPDVRQLRSSPTFRGGAQPPPRRSGGGGSFPSISSYVRPVGRRRADPGDRDDDGPVPACTFEKSAGALGAAGPRWDPFVNARASEDLAKLSKDGLSVRARVTHRAQCVDLIQISSVRPLPLALHALGVAPPRAECARLGVRLGGLSAIPLPVPRASCTS
jgi:hypothetical protein